MRQDIQTIIVPHEDAYRDLTDVIETLTIEKNLQAEEIRALKETNQRISRTLVLRSAPVAVQVRRNSLCITEGLWKKCISFASLGRRLHKCLCVCRLRLPAPCNGKKNRACNEE